MPTTTPTATSSGSSGTPTPPPEDCTATDEKSRSTYEAWNAQSNAWGPLTGKTFTGYAEGGPDLTLTIDEDGGARLVVGQPAPPPQGNLGYLCGDGLQYGSRCGIRYNAAPVDGGVYELHGGTFADDRLLVPVQLNGPYDAWCALQTPRELDVCFFQPISLDGFSVTPSTDMCTLGTTSVDCDWLELAQLGVCNCTSSSCFAAIYTDAPAQIDARFDETTHELAGSFINGDRARIAVHLTEATP
jgi:hypothetical protein